MGVFRIDKEVSTIVTIEDVKQYIGFRRDDKNTEIASAIEVAVSYIEDRKDIALRNLELKQISEVFDNRVQLYYKNVSEIQSVQDEESRDLDFQFLKNSSVLQIPKINSKVIVRYNSTQHENAEFYKNAITTFAALIFDGCTSSEAYDSIRKWV